MYREIQIIFVQILSVSRCLRKAQIRQQEQLQLQIQIINKHILQSQQTNKRYQIQRKRQQRQEREESIGFSKDLKQLSDNLTKLQNTQLKVDTLMSRNISNSFSQEFKEAEEAPDDEIQFKGVYFNPLIPSRISAKKKERNNQPKKTGSVSLRDHFDKITKIKEKEMLQQQQELNHQEKLGQPTTNSANLSMENNQKYEQIKEISQQISVDNQTKLIQNNQDFSTKTLKQQESYSSDNRQRSVDLCKKTKNLQIRSESLKSQKKGSQLKIGASINQTNQNRKRRRISNKNASPLEISSNLPSLLQKRIKPFKLANQSPLSSLNELDDDVEEEEDNVSYTQKIQQQHFPTNFVTDNYQFHKLEKSQNTSDLSSPNVFPSCERKQNLSFSEESDVDEKSKNKLSKQLTKEIHLNKSLTAGLSKININNNEWQKQSQMREPQFQSNEMQTSEEKKQIGYPLRMKEELLETNFYSKNKLVRNLDDEDYSIIRVTIEKVNIKPFQTVIAEIQQVLKINRSLIEISLRPKQVIQAILKQSFLLQSCPLIGETYDFKFKTIFKNDTATIVHVDNYTQI